MLKTKKVQEQASPEFTYRRYDSGRGHTTTSLTFDQGWRSIRCSMIPYLLSGITNLPDFARWTARLQFYHAYASVLQPAMPAPDCAEAPGVSPDCSPFRPHVYTQKSKYCVSRDMITAGERARYLPESRGAAVERTLLLSLLPRPAAWAACGRTCPNARCQHLSLSPLSALRTLGRRTALHFAPIHCCMLSFGRHASSHE